MKHLICITHLLINGQGLSVTYYGLQLAIIAVCLFVSLLTNVRTNETAVTVQRVTMPTETPSHKIAQRTTDAVKMLSTVLVYFFNVKGCSPRSQQPLFTQLWIIQRLTSQKKTSMHRCLVGAVLIHYTITTSVSSCVAPPTHIVTITHSPVFVSNADIHHARNRTLQMKHTCTNSISLLLRTLNILVMMLFLDILQFCSSSMVVCGWVILGV